MVTEDTTTTTEDSVAEEKVSKKTKAKKPEKPEYDFTESDVGNISNMNVYLVRVKETDADGNRAWKEYKVAATGEKAALKLVGHNNYDPVSVTARGGYEE